MNGAPAVLERIPPLRLAALAAGFDAVLTAPFVFRSPAEGETLRYALGLWRWMEGRIPLERAFNAELSFAYYGLTRALAGMLDPGLAGLHGLLHILAWCTGVGAAFALHLWFRRTFDAGTAVVGSLLVSLSPPFWSLHLWGNANMAGLPAAILFALLLPRPPRKTWPPRVGAHPSVSPDSPGRTRRVRLRVAAAALAGAAALALRADMLLFAPAVAAFALSGRTRGRWAAAAGLLAVAIWTVARIAVLGPPEGGGTVLRHLRGNLDLSHARWTAFNAASLMLAGPPAVLLASTVAFVFAGGPQARRMRRFALVWGAPALLFLPFARVHLTRVLLPVWPALLLPLAVWAGRSPKRIAAAAVLAVAAHAVMLPVPRLLDAAGWRPLATATPTQGVFLGNMFVDHGAIEALSSRRREEARAVAAGLSHEPIVVAAGETIYFEHAIQEAIPEARFSQVGSAYLVFLQEARRPDGTPIAWLLARYRGGAVEDHLREVGFDGTARIYRAAEDRRAFGDGP